MINASAQLHCDGGIGAMVQLDSGNRKVAMSGIESPENWFEDFGSAQLGTVCDEQVRELLRGA